MDARVYVLVARVSGRREKGEREGKREEESVKKEGDKGYALNFHQEPKN